MTKYFAKTQALKKKREEKGYSQGSMAGLIRATLGVSLSRQYYCHIEVGIRATTPDVVVYIAKLLDAEIDELFTSEKPEVAENKPVYAEPNNTQLERQEHELT